MDNLTERMLSSHLFLQQLTEGVGSAAQRLPQLQEIQAARPLHAQPPQTACCAAPTGAGSFVFQQSVLGWVGDATCLAKLQETQAPEILHVQLA
jgi:hypothetical protein